MWRLSISHNVIFSKLQETDIDDNLREEEELDRVNCDKLKKEKETDIDDNLREEEELDRINCDKLKKEKVAQESEQQENPKESYGRSYRNEFKFKWLKIQYDRRTRAKKVAEEELFSLKKEYEENAREWIRKLKKVRDERENDQKQWDEERNNLIAQLGDATESSKMYNDLSREYEENRRKWEEEKNDLVAKLDAAVASSKLYRGFLHDFDHY
ncbi:unnamed protein product [Ilex paraguariensis]|uniref:Uncharacterized protein n=1 Tax=Ilex paraguariensis TaxID=185542 RepID=A0ABC8SFY0_9AQUA